MAFAVVDSNSPASSPNAPYLQVQSSTLSSNAPGTSNTPTEKKRRRPDSNPPLRALQSRQTHAPSKTSSVKTWEASVLPGSNFDPPAGFIRGIPDDHEQKTRAARSF